MNTLIYAHTHACTHPTAASDKDNEERQTESHDEAARMSSEAGQKHKSVTPSVGDGFNSHCLEDVESPAL